MYLDYIKRRQGAAQPIQTKWAGPKLAEIAYFLSLGCLRTSRFGWARGFLVAKLVGPESPDFLVAGPESQRRLND